MLAVTSDILFLDKFNTPLAETKSLTFLLGHLKLNLFLKWIKQQVVLYHLFKIFSSTIYV